MKRFSWSQVAVAAALVVLGGLAFAFDGDEEVKVDVKVMKTGGDRVEVVVNDASEVITIDDLADGEERKIEAGDREITVRRDGDKLEVSLDGNEFIHKHHGSAAKAMVWVEADSEADGEAHKIVIKTDAEGGHHCKKAYAYRVDIDEEHEGEIAKIIELKLKDLEGLEDIDIEEIREMHHGEPMVVKVLGDDHVFIGHPEGPKRVRYRCEDDGSELLVPADRAIEDSYISPATGCVMQKVEAEDVKVVKVIRKKETDCDKEDE